MWDGRTITAAEAEQYLGVPATTVRAWACDTTRLIREDVAARGALAAIDEPTALPRRLIAVGILPDGQVLYRLDHVVELVAKTHRRPTRRAGVLTA